MLNTGSFFSLKNIYRSYFMLNWHDFDKLDKIWVQFAYKGMFRIKISCIWTVFQVYSWEYLRTPSHTNEIVRIDWKLKNLRRTKNIEKTGNILNQLSEILKKKLFWIQSSTRLLVSRQGSYCSECSFFLCFSWTSNNYWIFQKRKSFKKKISGFFENHPLTRYEKYKMVHFAYINRTNCSYQGEVLSVPIAL